MGAMSKTNNLSLKQPYFVLASDCYYKAVIMDYGISHFYCFTKRSNLQNNIIAIPDGCIDILFGCDPEEPYADICGTVLSPTVTHNNKDLYFFGVRFMPGNILANKKISMAELVENEVPLLDIIEDREFFEKIVTSRDFKFQIQVFMEEYLKQYKKYETRTQSIAATVTDLIIESSGQRKIQEIADMTGYSVRYINRVFTDTMGLSPKSFSKLMRFQCLVGNLNNALNMDMADLSVDMGYYDQSHMIKDFCKLADATPTNYLSSLKEQGYTKKLILI